MQNPSHSEAAEQSQDAPPSNGSREPLYLRLYFKPHLTDMARVFRYDSVPIDEAREKLKVLSDKYGQPVIGEAADELLLVEYREGEQTARLKDHVRKIAFGLLGSPPVECVERSRHGENTVEALDDEDDDLEAFDLRDDEPPEEDEESDATETTETSPRETEAQSQGPRWMPFDLAKASGKPVRRPQQEVRVEFGTWATANGLAIQSLSMERLKELCPTFRTAPDFLITSDDIPQLISVRPKLSPAQLYDLENWQRVFGVHHRLLRVWPFKGSDGWAWVAETILSPRKTSDLEPPGASQSTAVSAGDAYEVSATEARPATHPESVGKSIDISHVVHHLDMVEGELSGLDDLLKQAEYVQRELHRKLQEVREQLQRATETTTIEESAKSN